MIERSHRMRVPLDRARAVQRLRALLEREGYPRLQMLLLVAITGASGFVASYVLLRLGLTEMWLRYLAAFGLAYLVFLLLLWLWLRTRAEDYAESPEVFPSQGGGAPGASFEGRGGEFGGSGASGRFDLPEGAAAVEPDAAAAVGDGLGAVADADELAIPLALLLVIVGVLAAVVLSSFWVVYSAPVLFAELLLDGVLAASLYRRLRGIDSRHWIETALRRTALPFAAAAIVTALIGFGLTRYAPEADSIGDVVRHVQGGR